MEGWLYFVPGACPLEAEVDEYMDLIITKIPKVKKGHICFDLGINILHEELQKLFEFNLFKARRLWH
jgi:hypothetical protein